MVEKITTDVATVRNRRDVFAGLRPLFEKLRGEGISEESAREDALHAADHGIESLSSGGGTYQVEKTIFGIGSKKVQERFKPVTSDPKELRKIVTGPDRHRRSYGMSPDDRFIEEEL